MCVLGCGRTRADSHLKNLSDQICKTRSWARKNPKMECRILWPRNPCPSPWQRAPTNNRKRNEIKSNICSNKTKSLIAICSGRNRGFREGTVWTFLCKELKLLPYRVQIVTELSDADEQKRILFAEQCHQELRNDAGYFRSILFFNKYHKISWQ